MKIIKILCLEVCHDFDDKMNIININCVTRERIYTKAEKEEMLRKKQEQTALEKVQQEDTARFEKQRELERQAQEKARAEELARLEQERTQKEKAQQEKMKQTEEWKNQKELHKQQQVDSGERGIDFFLRAGGFAGTDTRKSDDSFYSISDTKIDNIGANIGLGVRFYSGLNAKGNIKYYGDIEGLFAGGGESTDLYAQVAGGYYLTERLSLRLGGGVGMIKREIEYMGPFGTGHKKLDETGYKVFGGLEYEIKRWLNIYGEYAYVSPIKSSSIEVTSTGYISLGFRFLL